MNKYRIGLRCGGLMEDPLWHHEDILEITSDSLENAINQWATLSANDKSPYWNPTHRSLWGWSVVDVDADMSYIIESNNRLKL